MSVMPLRQAFVLGVLLLAQCVTAAAQARVEKSVIYGMYSGAALLLDVHYPARPNGFGIVFIPGSGWNAPLRYSAPPLKESSQVEIYAPSLLEAGYTVFTISHRATPTFKYPAAVEDVQRAVRYIRHNAAKYGIDPARIGGSGGSSGGHLVSLLGTMDGASLADAMCSLFDAGSIRLCELGRAAILVHGDFGGRNILVAPYEDVGWRISGLIDWEASFAGSSLWDVGSLFRYSRRYSEAFRKRFERGYRDAGGDLPADWLRTARLLDATRQVATLNEERERPIVFAEYREFIESVVTEGV